MVEVPINVDNNIAIYLDHFTPNPIKRHNYNLEDEGSEWLGFFCLASTDLLYDV